MPDLPIRLAALSSAVLLLGSAASAAPPQGCSPGWIPSFGSIGGTDDFVFRTEVVDFGAGPELVAGGAFTRAGGVAASLVARFDGTDWQPMGSGFTFPTEFSAIATLDTGSGPVLHVSGDIRLPDGTRGPLARWTGATWEIVPGLDAGNATNMVAFDGGSGPALYLLGEFDFVGSPSYRGLARYDGTAWTNPLDGPIWTAQLFPTALEIFDDGSGAGPALFVGGAGYFYRPPGMSIQILGVSKVVGRDLVPIDEWPGYDPFGRVAAMEVFDDGSGPQLYVGHTAEQVWTGPALGGVHRWDGSSWTRVSSPLGDEMLVIDLETFDDGSGDRLYIAGELRPPVGGPFNRIACFDGSTWTAVGEGINGGPQPIIWSLTSGDVGAGPRLFAGGYFQSAGGVPAKHAAQFDGTAWSDVGPAGRAPAADVFALTTFDDGTGSALYAGGYFDAAGRTLCGGVARWDGSGWDALGQGMTNSVPFRSVRAFAAFDDGSGESLYAAGNFDLADGSPVNHVARWDGAGWQSVGGGVEIPQPGFPSLSDPAVLDLLVHDDGTGAALYACGQFASAGGVAASGIARWDGSTWSPLGSGATTGMFGLLDRVSALAVFDDGVNGPELYAAGGFSSMGGAPNTAGIARWDGTAWRSLGAGAIGGFATTLAVVDVGAGPRLWIGGGLRFTPNGPLEVLVEWDGSTLTPVQGAFQGPGALLSVDSIATYDDGSGARDLVYLGGQPDSNQPQPWTSVWRLDSTGWTGLAGGPQDSVHALHVHDDGSGHGATLFVGGRFSSLETVDDAYLARYGGCAPGLVGDEYCQSAPNSSGLPGRMRGFGSPFVARNDLVLIADDLPPGAFGYFLASRDQGQFMPPMSQGTLCLGGAIGRYSAPTQVRVADPQGSFDLRVELTAIPQPMGFVSAAAGETWNFQAWHRDANPMVTTNFTTGLSVTLR